MNENVCVNADLPWRVTEIGDFLGIDRVKAYRLLKSGTIPGRLMGGKWCARRSELDAAFRFAAHERNVRS